MTPIFVPSTSRRALAYSVDSIILQILWLPMTVQIVGSYLKSREISIGIEWVILSSILGLGYSVLFNYFMSGTIGKLLFGLKVINRNDPEKGLSLMQCLLRALTDHLSWFFALAGQSLMFLRFDRTHLSDWVAETRVVQSFERESPPKRRPVVAALLFFYFLVTGFSSAYQAIQKTDLENGKVIYHQNASGESPTN